MNLTAEQKAKTGAFYTPKEWAELAVKYIKAEVTNIYDYVFYDPACGEGALLEALPTGVGCFGTTLEEADVEICRNKGLNVKQLDFLQENEETNGWIEARFKRIDRGKLIVFTNPPYLKLSKEQYPKIKEKYGTNDTVALFYYKIFYEISPLLICSFNKMDIFQGTKMRDFRTDLELFHSTKSGFMTHSKTWGLKGSFPVVFNIIGSIYNGGAFREKNYIDFDVYETLPFKKRIY